MKTKPTIPDQDIFLRGVQLGLLLAGGKEITSSLIRECFGVSRATAKRDMVRLQQVAAPTTHVEVAPRRQTVIRKAK